MSTSWLDLRAAWTSGWRTLSETANRQYAALITANPAAYAPSVTAFQAELAASRATLNRLRDRLASPGINDADRARYAGLERRWHELAAGLYADAAPAQGTVPQPVIGVAPAVLVAGGVAVGVVGVAWSVAAYQYAVNLREQTALADRELEARVAASEQGRVLQPSTLPAPPNPKDDASNVGLWLLGGLAVVAGALTIPILLQKRGAHA
jgi:hypothetical protein